jgi:hypothetical protein
MPSDQQITAAIEVGEKMADDTVARRREARERRASALAAHRSPLTVTTQISAGGTRISECTTQTVGYLLAVGDSWFNYPFHDVLKELDELGYDIESTAHHGDRIESMAYHGGQIDEFGRCLDKLIHKGAKPKAILLSGGGNDIAGEEFGMLLNSSESGIHGWNDEIVEGVLNERVACAYCSLIASLDKVCLELAKCTFPILVHGYGYPVPDGRGVWEGWLLPGPWLKPGFREKLFKDLPTNVVLMKGLIDRFNEMLGGLTKARRFADVHYIDLRSLLPPELEDDAYKVWWANELHPTKEGFKLIADAFADVLSRL